MTMHTVFLVAEVHSENEESSELEGPNGGRLLVDGNLQVEVTIFESGVPPQYRIYAYDNGKKIDPSALSVTITLTRIRGVIEKFPLSPEGQYLSSPKVVTEPHSFDVLVEAIWKGKKSSWKYESYEGRAEISQKALDRSNILIEPSRSVKIKETLETTAQILPNEDRLVRVRSRYPGVVKKIHKKLGEQVQKGDLLAVVESNGGLNRLEIRSSISGHVVSKDAAVGEFVTEQRPILIIADLKSVWIDIPLYRDDFTKVKVGQQLMIELDDGSKISANISYVSPFAVLSSQTLMARAVVDNQQGALIPGLHVRTHIVIAERQVPVAVKREAIQTFRDWQVVFIRDGNTFEIVPVSLGIADEQWVEVKEGLTLGEEYVSTNSFILKADVLKSGASHDH